MSSGGANRDGEYDSLSGCFLRLFWLMAGNALLALALLQILFSRAPFFSRVDLFFWSIVGLIIIARFADVTYFHGSNARGEPASVYDSWRYVILLLVVATSAWLLAHLAADWLQVPNAPLPSVAE
jgi:hypothetical protein